MRNLENTTRRPFSTLLLLGLASCGAGTPRPPEAEPSAPNVPSPNPTAGSTGFFVSGGVQVGTRSALAVQEIFADEPPPGHTFDSWVGETGLLLQPEERRSGVRGPSPSGSVSARYRPAPAFAPAMLVVNNLPETDRNAVKAYFAFPSGPPRGVVFRFHGSNGSGGALFTKAEESRFARDLVADGFAVVALDSNDRQNRQWDNRVNAANPSENKDVANIQGVIQMLVDEGLMTPQTPCFASGHSNGGGFAPRAAYMLGWKASHSSCASSQASLMQITSVPQIFTMMENDELTGPSARAEALANHDLLESRGVASEYWVNPPSALYPTRFMQIEGLSAADSAELYEALKREGFLDEQGFQKQSPRTSGWERALTPNTRERRSAIEDLLKAAYADHSFSADRSALLRRFFAARLE